MYTTSTAYKTEIQKRVRSFECRVTIGDRVFTNNEVQSIDLNGGIQDVFSIGNTPSVCLELVLRNTTDTIFTTNSVKVEIGIKIGNTIEYIPLGIFNIEDIKKDDYTTKFTCYDNMTKFEIAYFSSLGDRPTLQQVVNELASKTGLQFTGSLPSYTVKKLEGFTCREVLGYVASLCGGNALITRDGNFTIVYPTDISRDVGEGVFDLQRDEVKYKVGKITCQVKEQETISKGSLGTDSMELSFENPWVTETILTDIYNRLNGFNYLGYTMKWQGDLSLDIGDIITYTDTKKVTRKLPILYRKLSYDGGLDSELSAKGETKNKNSFNSSGSMSNKVNRLVTEQAIIKEAIIEKANIEDLKATNAEIANLKVKDTEIENALIKKATIEQLNAANANIQNLIAEDARINNLVASKASITELNAVSAKIGTVEADTAIIKDLLAGNVTAGSGQIIHLTAKNVTIEDAVIKNLIAAKLSVSDLQAGTISTNKFTIASTDGGLNIVGPTMQFKDKNNKVRIQMGQDTQGNFNFILRGADGTTTLIDHTGIKEKAIADKLIKSNMVADNAIGEQQINYSSLITGINKDTNTQLIKASKVAIDLTGQSLEVAFNSLKSDVDNIEIGGRNILVNSEDLFLSGSDQPTSTKREKGKITVLKPYAFNTYTFLYKSDSTLSVSFSKPWEELISVGNEVILGMDIKTTGLTVSGLKMTLDFRRGSIKNGLGTVAIEPNQNGKWVRYYITIKSTSIESTSSLLNIYHDSSLDFTGVIIEYRNCMIEEGNKPSAYSKAPEDVEKVTNNLQTQITVAQGKIEGLIKDTTITEGSSSTSLKDAYISLKATVNGLNSTVASHTSSITTVKTDLGKVDGKINTAKSDAISTASADATSKSNKAKTDAIAAASSDATSKANNALNSAKSYTNAQITTVNTRVSNAESSITQLNNSITNKVWQTDIDKTVNEIQISGLNLISGTSSEWISYNGIDGCPHYYNFNTDFKLYPGIYTISWEYEYISGYGLTINVGCGPSPTNAFTKDISYGKSMKTANSFTFEVKEEHISDGRVYFGYRFRMEKKAHSCRIRRVKLEKGKIVTPWSNSLNDLKIDVQNKINNFNTSIVQPIKTEVTTVKEKAATLETNLNGITSKVTNLESTTSTINGKVTAQETRLQSTEQKVTATGVITTITEAINAGTNSLTTMQFILDKNGATIKNGALRILNKTGKAVLSGDSDGNLTMVGTYANYDNNTGKLGLSINSSNLYLHDWEHDSRVLALLGSVYKTDDPSIKGVMLGHYQDGYMALTYQSSNDVFSNYMEFDKYGVTEPLGAEVYPIRIYSDTRLSGLTKFTGGVLMKSNMDIWSTTKVIRAPLEFHQSSVNTPRGALATYTNGRFGLSGISGITNLYFDMRESATSNTYNSIGRISDTGLYVWGDIACSGKKTRAVETLNYGVRALNAYETADCYFGDLGSAQIGENGDISIFFDTIFMETVNTHEEYHVFLQNYSRGIVEEIIKEIDHFTVKGTPGMKFSWEVKCKQRDYELTRLNTLENNVPVVSLSENNIFENEVDYGAEGVDYYIKRKEVG